MDRHLSTIQTYLTAITLFLTSIIFVPVLNNTYTLPKLLILYFCSFVIVFFEGIKIIIQKKIKILKMDIFVFLLLLSQLASWYFAHNRVQAFWGEYGLEGLSFFSFIAYLSLVFVYARLDSFQKKIIKSFFVGGTSIAILYAVWQYTQVPNRPNGLAGQPIESAHTIALGLLVSYDLFYRYILSTKNKFFISLYLIFNILYLISLYLLESSTTFISLTTAILLIFIFNIQSVRENLNKKNILLVLTGVCVLALILFNLLPKKSFSTSQRISELRSSLRMIYLEVPSSPLSLLFGRGQNSSGLYFRPYKDASVFKTTEWFWQLGQIRNFYLESFFTLGLLGFIIWHLLALWSLLESVRNKKYFSAAIFFFILSWEMVYYLFPITVTIFLLYAAENNESVTKKFNNKFLYLIFSVVLIVLSIYGLFHSYRLLKGEYAYSRSNYDEAIQTVPENIVYKAEYAHAIYNSINSYRFYADTCVHNSSCSHRYVHEKYDKGTRLLIEALKINPKESDYWNALSTYYFQQYLDEGSVQKELLQKADETTRKGLVIDPYNPFLLDGLGAVYLERGDLGQAEKYFRKALQSKPDFTPSQGHVEEVERQKKK